jgi:hypothetical protein
MNKVEVGSVTIMRKVEAKGSVTILREWLSNYNGKVEHWLNRPFSIMKE